MRIDREMRITARVGREMASVRGMRIAREIPVA